MKPVKQKPTEYQLAERRRYAALIALSKKVCATKGLRVMELQLEYLKSHPTTKLPDEKVGWKDTCECYQVGINHYKDDLAGKGGVKIYGAGKTEEGRSDTQQTKEGTN